MNHKLFALLLASSTLTLCQRNDFDFVANSAARLTGGLLGEELGKDPQGNVFFSPLGIVAGIGNN